MILPTSVSLPRAWDSVLSYSSRTWARVSASTGGSWASRSCESSVERLCSGDIMLGIGPIAKLSETGGYFTRSIASQRRGLGVEIVMEVDDLGTAHRRVLDSGHPVFEPPQQRPWGLWDFRIVDPDGYYLRITSRAHETGEYMSASGE
jgi:lactoylglutathione lyase